MTKRFSKLLAVSLFVAALTFAITAPASTLPDGPGKAATERVCGKCHSPEKAATMRRSRYQWEDTMATMIKLGAQGTDEEFEAILGYLSKNFAPETPGPIYINRENVVDLETAMLLNRSAAKAVMQYRLVNGDFKTFADLARVPGVDSKKLEAVKSRIVF